MTSHSGSGLNGVCMCPFSVVHNNNNINSNTNSDIQNIYTTAVRYTQKAACACACAEQTTTTSCLFIITQRLLVHAVDVHGEYDRQQDVERRPQTVEDGRAVGLQRQCSINTVSVSV